MAKAPVTPTYVGSVLIAEAMHQNLKAAQAANRNPLLMIGDFDKVFGTFDIKVNLPGNEDVFRVEVNRLHVTGQ